MINISLDVVKGIIFNESGLFHVITWTMVEQHIWRHMMPLVSNTNELTPVT